MGAYHDYASSPTSAFRSKTAYLLTAFIVLMTFLLFSPLPDRYDDDRDSFVQHIVGHRPSEGDVSRYAVIRIGDGRVEPITIHNVNSKYAFATLLAGTTEEKEYKDDNYFISTRILAYQLLHAPETRSEDRDIPFIVLVTDKVPQWQQKRLRQDGAIVVEVPSLSADWLKADSSAWEDCMTKLRLWELTQFERIVFLDVDHQLQSPLDAIFRDPAVAEQKTLNNAAAIYSDEAALPKTFAFASGPEMNHNHSYPPLDSAGDFPNHNYLNAGLFVLKPSLEMLEYYLSVLDIPDRFDSSLMEQNLLNQAHRREGNMPWQTLANTWNIHYPNKKDIEGGVVSIHDKFWAPEDAGLRDWMMGWRWKMEGYFEAWDLLRESR